MHRSQGSPDAPACGFSAAAVTLLRGAGVPFVSFDVLRDPQARAALPVLHDFPTFPQLVVHGQLVGGLDVLRQMQARARAGGGAGGVCVWRVGARIGGRQRQTLTLGRPPP